MTLFINFQDIQSYRRIRKSVWLINELFGGHLVAFCLVLIYYCQLPDIVMGYAAEEPLASQVFYVIFDTAILVLAAEFNSQVTSN